MYATYHLASAQELSGIVDTIKAAFKSKPITVIVEEDENKNEDDFELTDEQKTILDERLKEDRTNYLTAEESLNHIKEKYSL